MATQDEAHAKRCASVRFPGVDFAPMSARANKPKPRRIPKLGRHSSGQARVTLNGKVHYCGPWGTAAAHARYVELIEEWQARGERPAVRAPNPVQATLTLGALLGQFLDYVDSTGRYRKAGKPTSERAAYQNVVDALSRFAGVCPVSRLEESTLVAWRDTLERDPTLTRSGINRKVSRALRMIRWGRSRGLVPKVVWADVSSIEPLRRGEVGDRPERGRPRHAVSLDQVEAVAKYAAPQVGDMMRLQALCGMRPGEVLRMRWMDIQRQPADLPGADVWLYVVPGAKASHHGRDTRYVIPKAAQEILLRYPALPAACMFSPASAMEERRHRLRAARKSKLTPSQRRRDQDANRDYASSWDTHEYRRHVTRACEKAGVRVFTPHEIRHGFLTWAANTLSLSAAAAAANHRSVATTQRYVHVQPVDALSVAEAVQARIVDQRSG